jgi:hypothetical protein
MRDSHASQVASSRRAVGRAGTTRRHHWLAVAVLMALVLGIHLGCSTDSPLDVIGTTSAADNTTNQRAINCGGPASGPFVADQGHNGGSAASTTATVSTAGVVGAAPEAVYQSARYGDVTYVFSSLPPGTNYPVRLHFAENVFSSAGKRVFNVLINDKVVLAAYDIFASVGAHQAVVKTFSATADAYGEVHLYFESLINNAQVNGIELVTSSGADAGLDATGDGPTMHSVLLQWTASTTPGVTYDLLRGTVSGGPYTQIQSGVGGTSATDTTVMAGATYYYVARSQNSSGESVNSNEVKEVLP